MFALTSLSLWMRHFSTAEGSLATNLIRLESDAGHKSAEARFSKPFFNKIDENYQPNAQTNLISVFWKCGIQPVDVSELLTRNLRATGVLETKVIEILFLQSLDTKRTQRTAGTVYKRSTKNLVINTKQSVAISETPVLDFTDNRVQLECGRKIKRTFL